MKISSLRRVLICGTCAWLMWATPAQARFLQVDPVGYQDQKNLYAYVENDPVNHTDPDGRCIDNMCPVSAFWGSTEYNLAVRQTESRAAEITVPVFAGLVAGPAGRLLAPRIGRFLFSQTASLAYRQASAGGTHANFLRQVIAQTDRQIGQSIRSFNRTIAEHRDKIAHPERYMTRDSPTDPQAVARAQGDWQRTINRVTRQGEIAEEELRRRSLGGR